MPNAFECEWVREGYPIIMYWDFLLPWWGGSGLKALLEGLDFSADLTSGLVGWLELELGPLGESGMVRWVRTQNLRINSVLKEGDLCVLPAGIK